jgi:hypothetical protein
VPVGAVMPLFSVDRMSSWPDTALPPGAVISTEVP